MVQTSDTEAEARLRGDFVSISRRELRMVCRHHGDDSLVSRLFMAHFQRQHPLPPSVYVAAGRVAPDHPRDGSRPPAEGRLPDGRKVVVDETAVKISRRPATAPGPQQAGDDA